MTSTKKPKLPREAAYLHREAEQARGATVRSLSRLGGLIRQTRAWGFVEDHPMLVGGTIVGLSALIATGVMRRRRHQPEPSRPRKSLLWKLIKLPIRFAASTLMSAILVPTVAPETTSDIQPADVDT